MESDVEDNDEDKIDDGSISIKKKKVVNNHIKVDISGKNNWNKFANLADLETENGEKSALIQNVTKS